MKKLLQFAMLLFSTATFARIGIDTSNSKSNGPDATHKSNAITVLKNGNTALGSINPNAKLDIDGNIALRSSGALISAVISATDITKSYIHYSGTTTFDSLPSGFQQEQLLIIAFKAAVALTDKTGNIKRNGDFNATASDTLQLIWNGTNWIELQRSAN